MESQHSALRRWLDNLIIIREYDWIYWDDSLDVWHPPAPLKGDMIYPKNTRIIYIYIWGWLLRVLPSKADIDWPFDFRWVKRKRCRKVFRVMFTRIFRLLFEDVFINICWGTTELYQVCGRLERSEFVMFHLFCLFLLVQKKPGTSTTMATHNPHFTFMFHGFGVRGHFHRDLKKVTQKLHHHHFEVKQHTIRIPTQMLHSWNVFLRLPCPKLKPQVASGQWFDNRSTLEYTQSIDLLWYKSTKRECDTLLLLYVSLLKVERKTYL